MIPLKEADDAHRVGDNSAASVLDQRRDGVDRIDARDAACIPVSAPEVEISGAASIQRRVESILAGER